MSWLFSRVLVEEYSAATCSAGAQSALLNGSHTPQAFLPPDRMTAFSRPSRFGMTFGPLTEDLGEGLLMWFLEGSHARTSVQPVTAPVLMANAPVSGEKWHELSVKFDPASSSWRTHLCLWDEDLPWSLVTLPRWGMTRNGHVFQHPTAERPMNVTVSGLWPTITVCGNYNRKGASKYSGDGLATAVRKYPTPTASASASKGSSIGALTRKNGKSRQNDRLDHAVMASDGGQLNPTWVEWLMGWPLGWTELKPLEMDRFQEWQLQHSNYFLEDEA